MFGIFKNKTSKQREQDRINAVGQKLEKMLPEVLGPGKLSNSKFISTEKDWYGSKRMYESYYWPADMPADALNPAKSERRPYKVVVAYRVKATRLAKRLLGDVIGKQYTTISIPFLYVGKFVPDGAKLSFKPSDTLLFYDKRIKKWEEMLGPVPEPKVMYNNYVSRPPVPDSITHLFGDVIVCPLYVWPIGTTCAYMPKNDLTLRLSREISRKNDDSIVLDHFEQDMWDKMDILRFDPESNTFKPTEYLGYIKRLAEQVISATSKN